MAAKHSQIAEESRELCGATNTLQNSLALSALASFLSYLAFAAGNSLQSTNEGTDDKLYIALEPSFPFKLTLKDTSFQASRLEAERNRQDPEFVLHVSGQLLSDLRICGSSRQEKAPYETVIHANMILLV